MGFVSDFVSGKSQNGYTELSDDDLQTPPSEEQQICFVDVRSQDDVITAKEALHRGNIIFLDIAYIESNGLSLETVTSEMQQAVSAVDGDIVHKKRSDTLIVTPRDVSINRQKL